MLYRVVTSELVPGDSLMVLPHPNASLLLVHSHARSSPVGRPERCTSLCRALGSIAFWWMFLSLIWDAGSFREMSWFFWVSCLRFVKQTERGSFAGWPATPEGSPRRSVRAPGPGAAPALSSPPAPGGASRDGSGEHTRRNRDCVHFTLFSSGTKCKKTLEGGVGAWKWLRTQNSMRGSSFIFLCTKVKPNDYSKCKWTKLNSEKDTDKSNINLCATQRYGKHLNIKGKWMKESILGKMLTKRKLE